MVFHEIEFPYKTTNSTSDDLFAKVILPVSTPVVLDNMIPLPSHSSTASSVPSATHS